MASDDLFAAEATSTAAAHAPLAERMRPRSLDEYAGQEHILGPGKLLRRAIEADRFSSVVLYGPPGTGKTSLAEIIARTTEAARGSVSSGAMKARSNLTSSTGRSRRYDSVA